MFVRSFIMAGALFTATAALAAQSVDFNSDPLGAAPRGWTFTMTGKGAPRWTVESDDSAPSKTHVLKQSGRATYPLALKEGTSMQDGFIETSFKADCRIRRPRGRRCLACNGRKQLLRGASQRS